MGVFAVSFAVYTLLIVGIGIYSARFARSSDEDIFLAGRSLGPWVAALSASASSESGWVTLGLVGWAFGSGFKAYWIIPGCLCGFVFNWFVLAGRLSDESRRLGALTIPDYFALRFKERLPIVRVLSVIVILTFYRGLARGEHGSAAGLGAILGGIASNTIDRVRYGSGVDFLHVGSTTTNTLPDFNLADVAIVLGVVTLVVELLATEMATRVSERPED